MAKNVHVILDDEKHKRHKQVKDWHDLTWEDVIDRGIETLDVPGAPPTEDE